MTKKNCKISRTELSQIIKNTEKKIGYKFEQPEIEALIKGMIKSNMLLSSKCIKK